MKKGNSVYIEGKLRTRSWDDKEGNKRYTTEIIADNMTMLGGKSDSNSSSQPESSSSNSSAFEDDSSGDLPF